MAIKYSKNTKGFYIQGFHTDIPTDAIDITEEYHRELLAGQCTGKMIVPDDKGFPILVDAPLPDLDARLEILSRQIQEFMDSSAKELGYDDIKTAITYAEEPEIQKYQNEGKAFRVWRSRVWNFFEQLCVDVKNGERAIPDYQNLRSVLPELVL